MNLKWLIGIAIFGILLGIISVIAYNQTLPTLAPLSINYNPYEAGLYASGIIESDQETGSNLDLYPEVAGTVVHVYVRDGDIIQKNAPLLALDDSIQKALVEKDQAQVSYEQAMLDNLKQQLEKIEKAYTINKQAISQNILDNARNAVIITKSNVEAAQKQYFSDLALLKRYIVKAPVTGKVIRMAATEGTYVSPAGSYDSYTQNFIPIVQMTVESPYLAVRCYLNEILVPKLPQALPLEATLFIRGLDRKSFALQYVSLQPYAQANIQLPNPQNNRVDVRVVPIIFRFAKAKHIPLYPGQLVDVYIKSST